MTKQLNLWRIGVYACHLDGSLISKGKRVTGYYGLYRDDLLNSMIIPDLREAKIAGWDFDFPVLVVSYRLRLREGNPPKPLPRPPGKLSAGGNVKLASLRRMLGFPREKVPESEIWEVVIDAQGQVLKVEGHGLKDH
jgi:hypothetical protein